MGAINSAQELFAAFFAICFALNIDRAQREYNPYDTYAVWKGSRHAIRRLVAAWVVTFILPMVQFAITFALLDNVQLTFDVSLSETLSIVGIGFFYPSSNSAIIASLRRSSTSGRRLSSWKRTGRSIFVKSGVSSVPISCRASCTWPGRS